jgi:cyclophilin family peptidyl-prolyl cis-trans isomerase
MTIDATKSYTATIKTAEGDITVDLLASQAPATVNNFVFLAREGFYDGLAFFFVDDEGTYAQAGDPDCTSGDNVATCDGGPGYDLPQEKPGAFDTGTLGMVNGSQFFIALGESDSFARYTPFGRITSGLDVAEQLARGTQIESIEIAEQ